MRKLIIRSMNKLLNFKGVIIMSKKYEHRVEHLKDHKHDKEENRHHDEIKPYSANNTVSQLKKAEKKFHKKIDESEYTWL
ncbi:MAG: hypothetical protein EAX89_12085 [Candidatus Lokiarchaeota archaeon]|nr:hypothetical protein [Candidatus Lokiarchaeota archaeon]